jgi:hypothetical protein
MNRHGAGQQRERVRGDGGDPGRHGRNVQLGRIARGRRIHRDDNSVPWTAIAAAGGTARRRPPHAQVAFKNGWLPYDGSWQGNSIGEVRGSGRQYLIAVMTDHSATESQGIATIEHISRAVWTDLTPHQLG